MLAELFLYSAAFHDSPASRRLSDNDGFSVACLKKPVSCISNMQEYLVPNMNIICEICKQEICNIHA